jgi:hypothetical protein
MPSGEHEAPVVLTKLSPDILVWLLANVFGVKVPDYHHSRSHSTDVQVLVARTYHADAMRVFCDADDRPLLAVVFEVQRGGDRAKLRRWKLYVAQLEVEMDVGTWLLVLCPRPKVAAWYRRQLDDDQSSLTLQPYIFTPDEVPLILDGRLARTNPALAVLSAICHGAHPEVDALFPALVAALRSLGPAGAIPYHDVVLAGLPSAARTRWEEFMSTTAVGREYLSEHLRALAAQHEARGRAEGEGIAVLTVLEARGITVSVEIREQILACTDVEQLDSWLRRAVSATTAEDVVRA